MKSAVIAFLTCLLVLYVQGQQEAGRTCKCLNGFVGRINTKIIKGLPVIQKPDTFCPQIQIIITTTTDQKQKCVNPESPLGKILLKNMNKKKENKVASTTMTMMTSSQTQNSTSPHSTSTTV